jgi:tetratricopeptide (TPR) repeat protein
MMREGDLVAIKTTGQKYALVKILRIDKWPDLTHAYHCLSYDLVDNVPPLEQIEALTVLVWHSPISGESIERDGTVIGNVAVRSEELVGFHEYLKQTNFARYVQETGFDLAIQIPLAQQHYQQGNQLAEQKRFQEAIEAYSKALDIFPPFMEALDNRGLTKMDLGLFQEAISDFEKSISAHGRNRLPFFSVGECYLKLGDYAAAEKIFVSCVNEWPQEVHFKLFLQMSRAKQSEASPPKKPWWRVW